jgi:response regulator NasT
MNGLQIILAEPDKHARRHLQGVLAQLGHRVTSVATGRELVGVARRAQPDLVVAGTQLLDMGGSEAAEKVNQLREMPVVLVASPHTAPCPALVRGDNVLAHLTPPVRPADMAAAVAVAMAAFAKYRDLKQEVADIRQALEDRKVIELAKHAVMKRLGVGEDEAFGRLRRVASQDQARLAAVARVVVAADEVFRRLADD